MFMLLSVINQNGFTSNNFSFQFVSENDVYRVINNIDSSKSYQKNNIPPSVEGMLQHFANALKGL